MTTGRVDCLGPSWFCSYRRLHSLSTRCQIGWLGEYGRRLLTIAGLACCCHRFLKTCCVDLRSRTGYGKMAILPAAPAALGPVRALTSLTPVAIRQTSKAPDFGIAVPDTAAHHAHPESTLPQDSLSRFLWGRD